MWPVDCLRKADRVSIGDAGRTGVPLASQRPEVETLPGLAGYGVVRHHVAASGDGPAAIAAIGSRRAG